MTIFLENGGTETLRIIEEIGRGGSCIAYLATVKGTSEDTKRTKIVKEFYPACGGAAGIRREGPALLIPTEREELFRELEGRFVEGASRFGDFYEWDQGKHSTAEPTIGTANNTSYAVSHLAGEHLLLDEPPLEMNAIAQVMKSVCMALEPFHAHGALYLDVKPSNTYWYEVDGTLHARLFDFDTVVDIADLKAGNLEFASHSRRWSSPEQEGWAVGSESADAMSPAADAWAVGAMLFWLITGRTPTWRHADGAANDVSLLKDGLFDWQGEKRYSIRFDRQGRIITKIDEIARKTLRKEPTSRCGSMAELARDFDELCSLSLSDTTTIEAIAEMLQRFHTEMQENLLRANAGNLDSPAGRYERIDSEAQLTGTRLNEGPQKYLPVDTPWGPNRPIFTWEKRATYATINSIMNNPTVGDERNFVQIRDINDSHYRDEISLESGHIYEVYIYYHNGADPDNVGKKAIGIADGLAVKSRFPARTEAGKRHSVNATIFASDTDPGAVWDGAYIRSSQDLHLRYVPGTATIHNGGGLNGQPIGPDYLFGEGALLGYNKFSGLLPGGSEYAGYVTYCLYASKYPNAIIGMTDPFDSSSWELSDNPKDKDCCKNGPDRPALAMDMRTPTPVFNSIVNNPIVGDERYYIRIGKITPTATIMKPGIEIEPGWQYLVYVYVNNNASPSRNGRSNNHEAVSLKTRLSCSFPDVVSPDSPGDLKATILSENANPRSTWCSIPITSSVERISLRYVLGSSRIFNDWKASGSIIPSSLFSSDGTLMGLNELNGVIPAGEKYQSVIAFVLQADSLRA